MNDIFFNTILLLGFTAVIGDFVIPAVISRRYPNYSQLRDTISTLGTNKSPVKKQASTWLIALGLLLICFGIGQSLQFIDHTWKHWLYIWGIIAFGVGAGIIAGVYPEDPKGMEETNTGKIHGISAGLGFMFLLLNPLLAAVHIELILIKPAPKNLNLHIVKKLKNKYQKGLARPGLLKATLSKKRS